MVDWSKIKKEYIEASDVPTGRGKGVPWEEVFGSIPKGKALVLHEPEINSATVRSALRMMQRRGKFRNLTMIAKGPRGKTMIYVTNTESPGTVMPTRRPRLTDTEEKAMRPS